MNKKIILMLCFCLVTFMAQAKTDENNYRDIGIHVDWNDGNDGDGDSQDEELGCHQVYHHGCTGGGDWHEFWLCFVQGVCIIGHNDD